MIKLENITKGTYLSGVMPNQTVEVIDAVWHGADVIEITFKDALGNPNNEILYRDNEVNLEIVQASAPWSFNASSNLFKLVSEAIEELSNVNFQCILPYDPSAKERFFNKILGYPELMLTLMKGNYESVKQTATSLIIFLKKEYHLENE